MSADPAMESYIPEASSNEGAGERNQNLPGMGGIYNSRNLQTYHYTGNNPLKYTDPSGRVINLIAAGGGVTQVVQNAMDGSPLTEGIETAVMAGGIGGAGGALVGHTRVPGGTPPPGAEDAVTQSEPSPVSNTSIATPENVDDVELTNTYRTGPRLQDAKDSNHFYRVDLEGKAHNGIDTPHTHHFGSPNPQNPSGKYTPTEVKPSTPGEIAREQARQAANTKPQS